MKDDLFESREEIISAFEPIRRLISRIEEEPIFGKESISLLTKIDHSVKHLALFSPNEDFDELDADIQPLVLLPCLLAYAESAARDDRLAALGRAETHFRAFIGLARHYELLSTTTARVFANSQSPTFRLPREDKVALYREERALLESAEKALGDRPKAFNRAATAFLALKAIGRFLLLPQERELLEFGARLANDPIARAAYEAERAQPIPKPTVTRIEASAEPTAVVQSFEQSAAAQRERAIVSNRANNPNNVRLEVLARLNQPDHAQPTMTIDEFDKLEYDLMTAKQSEARKAKAEREAQKAREGVEDSEDSENEIVADAKTFKARNWDDFKDANEKGGGNRNGK